MTTLTRRNLLGPDSQSFTNSTGYWYDLSHNSTLDRSAAFYVTSPLSLRITSLVNVDFEFLYLQTNTTGITVTPGATYRFSAFMRPDTTTTRDIWTVLQWLASDGTLLGSDSEVTTEQPNAFTLCSTIGTAPPNAVFVRPTISITSPTIGEIHYLDEASVVDWDAWKANISLQWVLPWISDYLTLADESTTPDHLLSRYMDVATLLQADVLQLVRDFFYRPVSEGGPAGSTSSLVDPDAAQTDWLPWLAQLVGVAPQSELISGFTAWDNLEAGAADWDVWESNWADWALIEAFDPIPFDVMALLRKQIRGAEAGFRAGTLNSMILAVQRVLSDTQSVTIIQNYLGSMWNVRIQTLAVETPSSSSVLDAAATTKPAGVVLSTVQV